MVCLAVLVGLYFCAGRVCARGNAARVFRPESSRLFSSSVFSNASSALPEAQGHIVTIELKTGELYRGHLLGASLFRLTCGISSLTRCCRLHSHPTHASLSALFLVFKNSRDRGQHELPHAKHYTDRSRWQGQQARIRLHSRIQDSLHDCSRHAQGMLRLHSPLNFSFMHANIVQRVSLFSHIRVLLFCSERAHV